jgi:hypothetical protein
VTPDDDTIYGPGDDRLFVDGEISVEQDPRTDGVTPIQQQEEK